ncbi:hypothetical protein [Flavobacterium sp. LAR06]|uniref:hypothetical protein n=1 Tax=Flavobacterium sp. LAR06 TaxID=3064897 RepID=UPI0035C17F59
MNQKLHDILSKEKLEKLGYIKKVFRKKKHYKYWWEIRNEDYALIVSYFLKFELQHLDSTVNGIKLKVKSLSDVEEAINWVLIETI